MDHEGMIKNTTDQAVQAKVWKFIYGFAESLVLRCSIELEIADTIHKHGKPMTLPELASQLPKQPVEISRLYRIIRYLVHMKLYTKGVSPTSGEVTYGLSPQAKYLIRGWPKSTVPTILSLDDKDLMKARHYFKDGLVENCIPFNKALGKSRWEYMSGDPEMSEIFNESMACDTRLVISALVNDCKSVFEGVKSTLVDVGGNTGTLAKVISSAFPHIKCSVYDLPHVIAAASPSDHPNINFIEGDMFKFVPSADAILMKYILHDWNDEECVEILKQCKKAVPQDGSGKVIIVDMVLNKDWKHPFTKTRLACDLHMMLVTGGKERSEEEWKKLFEAADFSGYKITEISSLQSVIVAYPYRSEGNVD